MYDERIVQSLMGLNPHRIVLVGEPVFRLATEAARALNLLDCSDTAPEIFKINHDELGSTTCAALSGDAAQHVMCMDLPINAANPEQLLGSACRASPNLLLVEQTTTHLNEDLLSDEHFFAFGFRVLEKSANSDRKRALYAYSLSNYKPAPDWLNSRFWANPERFHLTE